MAKFASVKHVSECFIKPKYEVEETNRPYHLSPWDLVYLTYHHNQNGLMFIKPSHWNNGSDHEKFSINKMLVSLKDSLSLTLVHFYPLAGQLTMQVNEEKHQSVVFVNCKKGPGARFIYATVDMSVSDIIHPPNEPEVPLVVQSLFGHDRAAVNMDGTSKPLLSIQVTELIDGVFIGCSANHAIVDGTSYWHFWNLWSKIHMDNDGNGHSLFPDLSLPIHNRDWFPDSCGPSIPLPFTHPDEFVSRFEAPPKLRERFFHFSSETIAKIKARCNSTSTRKVTVSSFQALSAFVWRAIVRANRAPLDQITNCHLIINNRVRLDTPFPQEYFGNSINVIKATTIVRELHEQTRGWAALLVHKAIASHNDKAVRHCVDEWVKSPFVTPLGILDPNSVLFSNSPRFNMYGNEFGLGKPIAVRSGSTNKYAGKVISFPGCEGEGSVDLEICLMPETFRALELDEEFMSAVSV